LNDAIKSNEIRLEMTLINVIDTDLFLRSDGVDGIHALTEGAVHTTGGVAVASVAEHLKAGTGHDR